VWLILFALQICDICRSDRGLVVCVTCVQSGLYILYYRRGGEHLSLRERDCFYYIIEQTYDVGLHSRRHPNLSLYVHLIVCHIYIYSLPLFIQWFQFIHDISTVCLHFTCESGCVGLRACLRSGLLQVWCGIACFPVSVCALVELWRV